MAQLGERTWTEADVLRAITVLGRHTRVDEAASELGVSRDGLKWHLKQHGRYKPSIYLGRALINSEPPPPPSEPAVAVIPEPSRPAGESPHNDDDEVEESLDEAIAVIRARRETAKLRRQLSDAVGRIATLQTTVDQLAAPLLRPVYAPPRRSSGTRREAWAITILSDVHAGAYVEPTRSVAMNEYSPEICRYRLDRYFDGVLSLTKSHAAGDFDIQGLLLNANGDLIDGQLHEDQTETSEAPLVTVDWLEPFLMGRFEQLASALPGIPIVLMWSYGNHSRDTAKPRAETAWAHSHEWAMAQRIARYFANHRQIRVIADKARDQYFEIYGRTIHSTHGDTVNYQGGVGGITIPLNKAIPVWDALRYADLHHIGHFHQQLDGGRWLANGSVVGYNAYARKINAKPEIAQQLFYLYDSHRGKTSVCPVWVTDLTLEQQIALADERKRWEAQQAA